jgi:hypothetical protein
MPAIVLLLRRDDPVGLPFANHHHDLLVFDASAARGRQLVRDAILARFFLDTVRLIGLAELETFRKRRAYR